MADSRETDAKIKQVRIERDHSSGSDRDVKEAEIRGLKKWKEYLDKER